MGRVCPGVTKVLLYIYKESVIIEKWIYDEKNDNGKGIKMGSLHSRTIEFDDMDQMTAVFGPFDTNIKLLEKKMNVTVIGQEMGIQITGEAAEVEKAAETVTTLKKMYNNKEAINESVIDQAAELVEDGAAEDAVTVMRDVITLTAKGKPVKCKTIGQKNYVKTIGENTVTICIGPAGTGKTYLAIAMAVNALKNEEISRIVLTRPAVEAGEHLGFLPGDLQSKVDPYLRPLYDALFEMLGEERFNRCLERGIIEVAPLAYMRGRTLGDSWIIVDESQNASLEQLLMVLTRLGEGSKVVVTGDITQVDLKDKASGLDTCARILHGIDKIGIVKLNNRDVVRHKLVKDIIKAFEKYQEQTENAGAKSGTKRGAVRFARRDGKPGASR